MSEQRTSSHPAAKGQTPPQAAVPSNRPTRQLGKTGAMVEIVSLGGEGILRTNGQHKSAVPMIEEVLRLGVRYIDTAPRSVEIFGRRYPIERAGVECPSIQLMRPLDNNS